ncbi:hypothetical protein GcM1_246119 [Golovinomyces cichoracearum]|uniref:Uncharacterized protein n=1 Tax=Golovinomyces cichoracearum TaxID=62708 RepID=A0A420IEK1_9PEZI|nr:hypothetical protein GcM1_246119 [Golovinomyces cichoracearum]
MSSCSLALCGHQKGLEDDDGNDGYEITSMDVFGGDSGVGGWEESIVLCVAVLNTSLRH